MVHSRASVSAKGLGMPKVKHIVLVLCTSFLSGCGLFVPKPHEIYEAKSNDMEFQNVIINNVKCELHRAVQQILHPPHGSPSKLTEWVKKWGAKVDLTFQTDEAGNFNPGAAFDPPGIFSLGLGLQSSAHATRIEEFAVTYAFLDLLNEGDIPDTCVNENGIMIQSDLDIKDFLVKHILLTTNPDTITVNPKNDNQFYDTLSYTIVFTASYSANATPTWTLKHVTVNPSGNFLEISRSKMTTLLIAFSGATPASSTGPAKLFPEGLTAYNASLIGKAVGSTPLLQR